MVSCILFRELHINTVENYLLYIHLNKLNVLLSVKWILIILLF